MEPNRNGTTQIWNHTDITTQIYSNHTDMTHIILTHTEIEAHNHQHLFINI